MPQKEEQCMQRFCKQISYQKTCTAWIYVCSFLKNFKFEHKNSFAVRKEFHKRLNRYRFFEGDPPFQKMVSKWCGILHTKRKSLFVVFAAIPWSVRPETRDRISRVLPRTYSAIWSRRQSFWPWFVQKSVQVGNQVLVSNSFLWKNSRFHFLLRVKQWGLFFFL